MVEHVGIMLVPVAWLALREIRIVAKLYLADVAIIVSMWSYGSTAATIP